MSCEFIKQLTKLRKLSLEAVDHTEKFDDFKRYMHVERAVELDLRCLLRDLNKSPHKRLVLLCGSAGDGKSHLLSYLKNSDEEQLLKNYEVYNDATESSAPNLTSIDTLAEKLQDYDDDHYLIDDGKKLILAINLGTLSNFIESDQGRHFSKLKDYVTNNDIFDSFSEMTENDPASVFQHINFSDYQMFSLRENGIETDYLEKLFGRVFNQQTDNPFYKVYKSQQICSLCTKCPVRHNYEFVMNENIQKSIIDKIVEIIIKDKMIVSTREILNLIYDLLVHPQFSFGSFCGKITSDMTYLTDYIQYTTPMLLYEYEGISVMIDHIRDYDFLKDRKAEMDLATISFYTLDNIEFSFLDATENTPYEFLKKGTRLTELGEMQPELKKMIYRFIVRLKDMKGDYTERQEIEPFSNYLKCLYYQNNPNKKNKIMAKLYDDTKKAILKWNGYFEEGLICIDETNEHYWILEQIDLKPMANGTIHIDSEEITKFSTLLNLKFRKNNGLSNECVNVCIDYALYIMICMMKDGYLPSIQDKNRHANFEGVIRQVIEFGSKDSKIILVPKDGEADRIVFEDTGFALEFKVVD